MAAAKKNHGNEKKILLFGNELQNIEQMVNKTGFLIHTSKLKLTVINNYIAKPWTKQLVL